MKPFFTASEKTLAYDEKKIYVAVRHFFSNNAASRGGEGYTSYEYSITNQPQNLDRVTQIQLTHPSMGTAFKTQVSKIIAEISGLSVSNPHYYITSGVYYTLTMFLTPAQYLQGCQAAAQQTATTTTTFSL